MDDRQALSFSREDMREIGYAVIDSLLVEAGATACRRRWRC
ncbi:MAG: hypothetical protein OXG92_11465 [Chloroflexi bacterium]|nr:hypothetical protein [Chloroflexota bacterium]MCY3582362.1 hypothetical protein [Chloroflexota bacterium]MCY3717072.1 hypothetical protein [Chloroflexota bacterium]MDE2650776.1 hypothetical protein [Chloroflexota bacterium]